ncbi:unnamed protein product [Echinostoma caproni]|uniref:F-BAR domain-containing protein n=1 Tax=Echinostoma caproni TaxID=27848 RepID=A0A183A5F8_9TREM|nr:unnamed protein product [Echinostoma caproni]
MTISQNHVFLSAQCWRGVIQWNRDSLRDGQYPADRGTSKWHILVFQCMRNRSEEMCRKTEEEKFRQLIWSISLETRKFEKAAAYMCHEHNLRILNEHKTKCLARQEKVAEQCNVHRNDTIREVVAALQNQSSQLSTSSNEYYGLMRKTLSHYECKSLLAKLECLYAVLHNTCPPDAVRLVMNYFKETLPDGCTFNYESRLQSHIDLELTRQKQQQQRQRMEEEERYTFQQDMGRRSSRAGAQLQLGRSVTGNSSNNGALALSSHSVNGFPIKEESGVQLAIIFVLFSLAHVWI